MKLRHRTGSLLILAEIIILIVVLVLGLTKHVRSQILGEPEGNVVVTETESASVVINAQMEEQVQENTENQEDGAAEVFPDEINAQLAAMTMEQKAAQLFAVTPETLTGNELVNVAGNATRDALGNYPVAGLIYTEKNYQGREQFQKLINNAQQYAWEAEGQYLLLLAQAENEGNVVTVVSRDYGADALTTVFMADGNPAEADGVDTVTVYQDPAELPYTADNLIVMNINAAGTDSIGETAVSAIKAGADLLYCTDSFAEAYQVVLDAAGSGTLDEETLNLHVGRILAQKAQMSMPEETAEDGQTAEVEQRASTTSANGAAAGRQTTTTTAATTATTTTTTTAAATATTTAADTAASQNTQENTADQTTQENTTQNTDSQEPTQSQATVGEAVQDGAAQTALDEDPQTVRNDEEE